MLQAGRERRVKNERQSLNEALLAKLTPRASSSKSSSSLGA